MISRAMWLTYHRTNDVELRNQIVVAYLPIPKKVCFKIKAGISDSRLDYQELLSFAYQGLIGAVEKFQVLDNYHDGSFPKFAYQHVRFRLIDDLRVQATCATANRALKKKLYYETTDQDFLLDAASSVTDACPFTATEQRQLLATAVNRLPLRQQLIIRYRHYKNATIEQTAQMIGLSSSVVISETHAAYQALRRHLESTGAPETLDP